MTRDIIFNGRYCRIVRISNPPSALQYLLEVHDGVDAMMVPRWRIPTGAADFVNVIPELCQAVDAGVVRPPPLVAKGIKR